MFYPDYVMAQTRIEDEELIYHYEGKMYRILVIIDEIYYLCETEIADVDIEIQRNDPDYMMMVTDLE